MTLRNAYKSSLMAALGAVALGFTMQAKAEGGDGGSVILPHEYELLQEAARARESAGPEAVETAEAAKDASQAGDGRDAAVERTSALAPMPVSPRSGGRQGDAARAREFRPLIARHASENELPFELADAVVRIESRYNAGARNGPHLGLTQLNLQTARSLGYKGDAAGLLDPETNLRYGLKYLAQAYRLAGGDTCGTILRYQAGHRAQTMTKASLAYCAKVKTIAAAAE